MCSMCVCVAVSVCECVCLCVCVQYVFVWESECVCIRSVCSSVPLGSAGERRQWREEHNAQLRQQDKGIIRVSNDTFIYLSFHITIKRVYSILCIRCVWRSSPTSVLTSSTDLKSLDINASFD